MKLAGKTAFLCFSICGQAAGQSLFLSPPPVILDDAGEPDPHADLRATSTFYVQPPEPPSFEQHDIVYVIIDENSRTQSLARLDARKQVNQNSEVAAVLDPLELLQLRLREGNLTNSALLELAVQSDFRSQGNYQRDDRVNARIAAKIIDVKPNGTLVLEARKNVDTDKEQRSIVLTGMARQEDITLQNTILSSQLAELDVSIQNKGELKKATTKGIFTRIIEALFAF